MEEKGRAVAIDDFSFAVQAQAGVGEEIDLPGILALQGGGDFGIGTDRILTEGGVVIVDQDARFIQNCERRKRGWFVGNGSGFWN